MPALNRALVALSMLGGGFVPGQLPRSQIANRGGQCALRDANPTPTPPHPPTTLCISGSMLGPGGLSTSCSSSSRSLEALPFRLPW